MPGISKMVAALKDGLTEETLKKVLKNFVYDETLITPDLIAMRWYIVKDQPKEVITTMKTPNLGPKIRRLHSCDDFLWLIFHNIPTHCNQVRCN